MSRLDSRGSTIRTTKQSSSTTDRPIRLPKSPPTPDACDCGSSTMAWPPRAMQAPPPHRGEDRRVHRRRRAGRSRLAVPSGRRQSRRRDAAAAAGPNFGPAARICPRRRDGSRARTAARGACRRRSPRAIVRMQHGDYQSRAAQAAGGFDPMFVTAGDDVDLSWRLGGRRPRRSRTRPERVIHQRRATLPAWGDRRRGWGAGEGLLWRNCCSKQRGPGPRYYTRGPSWIGSIARRRAGLFRRVGPRAVSDRLFGGQLVRRAAADRPMGRVVADFSDPRRDSIGCWAFSAPVDSRSRCWPRRRAPRRRPWRALIEARRRNLLLLDR